MSGALVLQFVLRLLPSIVLVVVGFLVVKDASMKKRWADILIRTGSISYSKAEDPKVLEGVRIPFFVLAVLFLAWPIKYYFQDSYAQTPGEAVPMESAASRPKKVAPGPTPLPTATPDPITRPDAPRPSAPAAPANSPGLPAPPSQPAADGRKTLG